MLGSLVRVPRTLPAPTPRGRGALARRGTMTLLLVLAVVWAFFYLQTGGTFLTQRNLILLALQTSIVSLAAISAVMLIVSRNFDLSVGSAVALVGVVLAVLTVKHDVDPGLAVLAALACGLAMGAWQGFWVTRLGVSSFIVTLAGMLYFRGLSMIITNGATVAPLPKSLTVFATGFLAPRFAVPLVLAAAAVYLATDGSAHATCPQARPSRGPAPGRDAVVPMLALTLLAVWLCLWKGMPYLVLLVACCARRRRDRHAPHPFRHADLCRRQQPRGGAPLGHRSQGRRVLELRPGRRRLWHHRHRAHGARRRGHRRQRRPVPRARRDRRRGHRRHSPARRPGHRARCAWWGPC